MRSIKLFILLALLLLFCFCHQEQVIPVEIDVALHIKDNNHTSPLSVMVENRTKSASGFLWTFEGGEPASSTKKDPGTIVFTEPGEHTVTIKAWNDGDSTDKTYTVRVDSTVTVTFKAAADINNYAPAVYKITNLSAGGSNYRWTFAGGEPSAYEGQHPPDITYADKGTYTVSLTVNNGSATFVSSQEIEVREALDASFRIVPSFEDIDDMEAPLRATFDTRLQGVETLNWVCEKATIANSASADATIYFPTAGQYTVYLHVSNGKHTRQVPQTVTVKENTNLRIHRDIRFGINTARETIGCYYSTGLRRSFKTSEVNADNGALIDIVFFGLNTDFTYNQFVSPNKLNDTPLPEIPGARPTKLINKTEPESVNLTSEQFNAMTTDTLLKDLLVDTAGYGDEFFTRLPLPHVILFETSDERKGVILIKEMITDGAENSYILTDIKVQKND